LGKAIKLVLTYFLCSEALFNFETGTFQYRSILTVAMKDFIMNSLYKINTF